MKLKLFIAILLFPFLAIAANTNSFDNVLIKNNMQFTGGTPGANKVLTSDAVGYYTPQSLISLDATLLTNATSTGGTVAITGQGTHVLNLESVFPTFGLTNITIVSAPYLVASGQGTRTITLTGQGTVVTNNSSPTLNALTVTSINGILPATIGTNITSSTLTVTGQGTKVFNIETPLVNAQTLTNITSASLNVTGQGTKVINLEAVISPVNVTNIVADPLLGLTGTGTKVYTFTPNFTSTGIVTNNSSPTFLGITINGNSVFGVNSSSTMSIVGTAVTAANGLNFNAGQYSYPATSTGTATNNSPMQFGSWVTITGGVTNLGGIFTSTLTVTNGGTFTGPATITSATPLNNTVFITSSNGQGNLAFSGGIIFPRIIVTANYTNKLGDSVVSYRGTTPFTSVTNFLPGAAANTFTNGYMLRIKDGQGSAATTNIILFGIGGATVDRAASATINANFGSKTAVLDAVNNNWEIY